MKKIAGVSLWIWGVGVLVLAGAIWLSIDLLGNGEKAWAIKGHAAARKMLENQAVIALDRLTLKNARELAKMQTTASRIERASASGQMHKLEAQIEYAEREDAKLRRQYTTVLYYLKEQEGMAHSCSDAIEKWVKDGQWMMKNVEDDAKRQDLQILLESDLDLVMRAYK